MTHQHWNWMVMSHNCIIIMRSNYLTLIYIIQVLWTVDTAFGSFLNFMENLPAKLQNAFENTWSILQQHLEVPIGPSRQRQRYIVITETSTASTISMFDSEIPETSSERAIMEIRKRVRPIIPIIQPKQPDWELDRRGPLSIEASKNYGPIIPVFPDRTEKTTHRARYYLKKKNNIYYTIPIFDQKF